MLNLVKTKLEEKHSKLQLAGNPLKEGVKTILKTGGMAKLWLAMRDSSWEKIIAT
jgi:hypothetical protein